MTRDRSKLLVASAFTLVCLYLCYRLAQPFIPALVFAITIAVVTQPLIRWLESRIKNASIRAAACVAIVTIAVLAPLASTIYFVAVEIGQAVKGWPDHYANLQQVVEERPQLASAWQHLSQNLDLGGTIERVAGAVNAGAMAVATGMFHSVFQVMVMLYVLFFIYRDRDRFLGAINKLSPLTTRETNDLLRRIDDTIHATVFGVISVALLQGTLGGLIFWLLGIPGAVMWGSMMAFLALIPNLGTFVIWGPTAVLLALGGHWGKGLVLAAWGLTAIGMIDNLLYPYLVGNRLRSHTVVVFLSILGGLAVFGAAGIVLGPVVVNLTIFLLELWRRRTDQTSAATK